MADRSSSDVSRRAEWRRRAAGAALVALGFVATVGAGALYYDAWSTEEAWTSSPEAEALARQLAEPTPIWLAAATPEPISVAIQPLPTPGARALAEPPAAPTPLVAAEPTPTVEASDLSLDATDFRFLDPPEPGAHARLAVTVSNHGPAISSRVLVGIPAKWFDNYSIVGTAPAVVEDRVDDDGLRTFSFPQIIAGATMTFELHVTATAEGTQAPTVTALLDNGDVIAEVDKLSTFAPTPRPGPVMSIDIPRLKLKSGVLQTPWEPPPFAVGQIKGTANVSQGNTVLVGHLSGAAGNVFAHLDQLQPGDEITATSRGLPYTFVVSRIFESSNRDSAPIQPADDSRLTLMTCAGLWNPLTRDYPERLWVIAEPPEQAAITIATVSATATAEAAATATAHALEPTATPVPTPYLGEPALAGGIGNSRINLERAFGQASGETPGKLVVFRQRDREVRVAFTPDPPRAALVAVVPSTGLPFEAAVRESRKLFPRDTQPRAAAPEGNPAFVVERFTSVSLGLALGTEEFSVIYVRDGKGTVTSIILGLSDDFDELIDQSQR